ncbi:Uncharacterised protein [Enterobacter hormaechei]|nr:Uncharacterised protein [Enterobacter hormaechei]
MQVFYNRQLIDIIYKQRSSIIWVISIDGHYIRNAFFSHTFIHALFSFWLAICISKKIKHASIHRPSAILNALIPLRPDPALHVLIIQLIKFFQANRKDTEHVPLFFFGQLAI